MVTYGLPVVYMLNDILFFKIMLLEGILLEVIFFKVVFVRVILYTQVYINSIGMAGKLC